MIIPYWRRRERRASEAYYETSTARSLKKARSLKGLVSFEYSKALLYIAMLGQFINCKEKYFYDRRALTSTYSRSIPP